jgi:hypothetical protein
MRLVLAPEPAPWLSRLSAVLGEAPAQVCAPWSLPGGPERWSAMPSRLRAAWRRRVPTVSGQARVWGLPGWWAVEAGLRLRGRSAATVFESRFLLRAAMARAVAPLLSPTRVETVVAPSLCAREVFAVARQRGARCVLIEDLPSLRRLHADLDEAAERHPEEAFLRNHRARARDVARQETERVLADEIWVRGAFARAHLLAVGVPAAKLRELREPRPLDAPVPRAAARAEGAQRVALLAGPALARSGLNEALAALEARPGWRLWVRPTEGTDLGRLAHPQVTRVTEAVQRGLEGVDAVLALSWCESHPMEVGLAAARGVPVIATDRAAGFLPGPRVPRGDVPAVLAALDAVAG